MPATQAQYVKLHLLLKLIIEFIKHFSPFARGCPVDDDLTVVDVLGTACVIVETALLNTLKLYSALERAYQQTAIMPLLYAILNSRAFYNIHILDSIIL